MTTKAKHTPGPWTVQEGNVVMGKSDRAPYQHKICETNGWDKGEVIANARLIKEAPALLLDLESLVNATSYFADNAELITEADTLELKQRIAMARATIRRTVSEV